MRVKIFGEIAQKTVPKVGNSEGSVTDWILGSVPCSVWKPTHRAYLLSIPVVTCIPETLPTALKQLNIGHRKPFQRSCKMPVRQSMKFLKQLGKVARLTLKKGAVSDILHEYESAGNASKNIIDVLDATAIYSEQN